MARKSKNIDDWGFAVLLSIALGTGIFFLIKWPIAGIIAISSVIIVGAINHKKKKEMEKAFKKRVESLFGDSYIRPTKNVNKEELKEKLGFIDTTVYDDLFDSVTIEKGKQYVWNKNITKVSIKNNVWSSIVHGKDTYNVKVYMEDDRVKKAECDCPYFHDKNKYCKHIYATLYFVKSAHNSQKVLDSISTFSKPLDQLIEMETDFINNHGYALDSEDIDEYMKNINAFKNTSLLAKKNINRNSQNEDLILHTLVSLMQDSYKLLQDFETMIIELDKTDYPIANKKKGSSNHSGNNSSNAALAAALVAGLFADDWNKKSKNKEQNKKLEKEMDIYGLEDWQKEEVRKGNYDPWNFEEEDLEEDDYFHDDS